MKTRALQGLNYNFYTKDSKMDEGLNILLKTIMACNHICNFVLALCVAKYLFKVIIVSLPVGGALVELSSQLLHSPFQLFPVAPHLGKSCSDKSSLPRGHKL